MTLNNLIEKYALTAKDLATITKTSLGNVRKIIKGDRVGKYALYLHLQRAFQISNADIYDIWLERSITYENHIKKNERG